jgi:predicted phage tail protein
MALDPKKFAWWKIILGLALIGIRFYVHYSLSLNPSKAESTVLQIGMGIAEGVMLVIGIALVYVGVKPNWNE